MIRKATEKDIDGIVAIYDKILDLQDEGKMSIGWAKNVYPTRDTVRKALERDDLFVYEENGKIIASAIINQIQVDVYEGASWEYSANDDEVLVIH
ncbi:MAG: GNAT family N-acetyltransferase, partial [Lachnospiraceae bacterium]|nr:GNAT family N-acetyltransferase [Lachnospiraceae bacterium]